MKTFNQQLLGMQRIALASLEAGQKRASLSCPLAKVNLEEAKAQIKNTILALEAAINEN